MSISSIGIFCFVYIHACALGDRLAMDLIYDYASWKIGVVTNIMHPIPYMSRI